MAVVCDNHFNIELFCNLHQRGIGHFLLFQPVILQLYVIIFAKKPFIELCCFNCLFFFAGNDVICQLALNAGR